LEIFIL